MHPQTALEIGEEVRAGLTRSGQKTLPTRFLYDDVGSALFDAITALPEYGLTRADLRVLRRCAPKVAAECPNVSEVVELGSGNGSKTRILLSAFKADIRYSPIDVSRAALNACTKELAEFDVQPIEADFLSGLRTAASRRKPESGLLVLFLGSNIGNFERSSIPEFFAELRSELQPGDALLIGADLIKPVEQLLLAYDDPAGVTAAFNRNLLARLNRSFHGNFSPRCFEHEARWNETQRRVEMHLRARSDQHIRLDALDLNVTVQSGETIHTESSHKFSLDELAGYSLTSGFSLLESWVDADWPFAEVLFRATKEAS